MTKPCNFPGRKQSALSRLPANAGRAARDAIVRAIENCGDRDTRTKKNRG